MGRFIPGGIEPHRGCRKAVWLLVLACGLLREAPDNLFAQAGESVRTYHVPTRSFKIPFNIQGMPNDPRIDVFLHVSRDGQPYQYVAAAKPQDQRFFFTAPGDGWYSFIVQTRDATGALTPADLRTVAPSIRVCVDTVSPVIEDFSAVAGQGYAPPTIRWSIVETNLKEIWADYRPIGSLDWMPLFLPVKKQDTQPWKPMYGGELEVRMQAVDSAGNKSEIRTARLRVPENVSRMPPPQEPAGAGKVMHVHSKTFQLDYKLDDKTIGPSSVAAVDIWKLPSGQGWRKCKEQGTASGPATVTVESSGRWGFRLIPRSGAGRAERDPQPGDAPDIWVEVDDKKPQVRITKVTVTQEQEVGYLTVYWTADDTFLRPMPIKIYLSDPRSRDFKEVATDLSNTGNWRQRTDNLGQPGQFEFLVKVTAIDEAGNVGSDQWSEVVKVDLKIPRIIHIEVKPGEAPTNTGSDAYNFPRTPPVGGQLSSGALPQTSVPPPNGQPFGPPPASTTNGRGPAFNVPDPPKR